MEWDVLLMVFHGFENFTDLKIEMQIDIYVLSSIFLIALQKSCNSVP